MQILALDLGTHAGFAYGSGTEVIKAGTWTLATPKEITAWGKQRLTRRNDPRMRRFQQELCRIPTPDLVVFEDVEFQTYTLQCQLWSAFRTTLWLSFESDTLFDCVDVSRLKRFAAGHGGATKEAMASALFKQYPGFKNWKLDDNAIDAIWILKWAQTNLSRIPR